MSLMAIESFDGDYRWLSNFYMCDVYYQEAMYPSSEHAYQASKTLIENERDVIRTIPAAGSAKRLGQLVTKRDDWDKVKILNMFVINLDKFKRNPVLGQLLIDTGDLQLVEGNNWNDTFWGVCQDE